MLTVQQIILIFAFILLICGMNALRKGLIEYGGELIALFCSTLRSLSFAVAGDPEVKLFIERHPRLSAAIRNRFSPDRFSGLPLTIIGLAVLGFAVLFADVVENILSSVAISYLDLGISGFLAAGRSNVMTSIMIWVTMLGHWQVLIVFTVAVAAVLLIWRRSVYILPLMFSLAGSMLFTESLKLVFQRGRPFSAVYTETTFSFPSGHATAAVAFYGFLTYLSLRNSHTLKAKVNVLIAGITVVFLIGFSRAYLGVHYPSDVWGGFLAGGLWLVIAVVFSEWRRSRSYARSAFTERFLRNVCSIIFISAALLFYVSLSIDYVSSVHPVDTGFSQTGRMP
jgi:membrane-associated phospholipid phosphatase